MVENTKTNKKVILIYIGISILLLFIGYISGFFNGITSEYKYNIHEKLSLKIGDSSYLDPKIMDDIFVQMESSNNNVAIINKDGKIEAISNGVTVITVRDEYFKI